jgi:SpoVK/Ycf46/Vps4 family AAA+-type ATPase
MATAEQIKSLIRSHFSDEPERFFTAALQVAAHEAQLGHGELAQEIRFIIDRAKKNRTSNVLRFPLELQGLIVSDTLTLPLAAMVTPLELKRRIQRVILEYKQRERLRSHGLLHRRKMLLVGPPGTGKTMTAKVIASEIHLQLCTVQIDKVLTKFMGESGAQLRRIFDLIKDQPAVYFFDEFDAIGGDRTIDNDVGEMRRVLNAFLQFIEQDHSDNLILAATNRPELLDRALYRRFDDVLAYDYPSKPERQQLMSNVLGSYLEKGFRWTSLLSESEGLSHAEIVQACVDAIKHALLNDRQNIGTGLLRSTLCERKDAINNQRR